MGKPVRAASRTSARRYSDHCSVRNGASAPWRIVRSGVGTTRPGSMPGTRPKPWHVGQAPTGLLKENRSGEGASKRIPSRSKNSEYGIASPARLPVATSTSARPPPSRKACSALSARRESVVSRSASVAPAAGTARRSTSTRRRAAGTLAAVAASATSLRSSVSGAAPFLRCASVGRTTTRKKPRARSTSSSSATVTLAAPFVALRSGRAKVSRKRSPGPSRRVTSSASERGVSRVTSSPETGETVRPMRAKSRRR